MYEETRVPALRRVLLLILAVIAAAMIVWAVTWLIFFRGHQATGNRHKTITPNSTSTKQKAPQQSTKPSAPSGSSGGSSSHGGNVPPANPPPAPGTSQPNNPPSGGQQPLANAGAGNVWLPVLGGTIGGAVAYHVYLRKRQRTSK